MYGRYKDRGLEIIAVNAQDDEATIRKYVKEEGWSFRFARDPDHAISSAYGVTATPTNVLIDSRGNIVYKGVGFDETGLRQALDDVLK
jgi:peroxiredoxin